VIVARACHTQNSTLLNKLDLGAVVAVCWETRQVKVKASWLAWAESVLF